MSLRRNTFHQYETFKEITLISGKKVKPMDIGMKGDQYMIQGIISEGVGRIEEIKKID